MKKMNFFKQLSSNKFIFIAIIFDIHLTFGQDHTPTSVLPNLANSSLPNEFKQDSNITWIKIATVTSNHTETSQHSSANCTIVENTSTEDQQNLDPDGGSRRRRRKRRRNKYKSWNQARRQPENSYKKHSTRVQLNKPVQFLLPPEYQENLIAKESSYYHNGNEQENVIDRGIQKKIPAPVRYLLPPFFDPSFTTLATPHRESTKKSKYVEWSPNTTNRGSTKFKHTVYYSDSGNEILSHPVASTTTTPRVKSTTVVDDRRALQTRIESAPKTHRQEYRPIVVQPTPSQYTTEILPNSTVGYAPKEQNENRLNNFLSLQVARAGMQVVNMSTYHKQQSQLFQNQYYPTTQNYKQFAQPTALQVQPQQQQHPQQINYQQYQQTNPPLATDPPSQISYQLQSQHLRTTPPTYNQQYPQQNYQHQTTYSRPPEIRTTPAAEFTTVRTTTSRSTDDNFKGLEIAESKYFSDLPSEQEFTAALQNDGQVIPGIAGKDYPVFDQALLQKRRFACRGLEGYFADVTSRCQVFYICNGDGAGEPMLCPNGTLFSQELLVCDWWYNVDC